MSELVNHPNAQSIAQTGRENEWMLQIAETTFRVYSDVTNLARHIRVSSETAANSATAQIVVETLEDLAERLFDHADALEMSFSPDAEGLARKGF